MPDPVTVPAAGDDRRMLMWFGIAGGAIAIIGLVVVIVMNVTTGLPGQQPPQPDGPQESLPPLAAACPPPTEPAPEGNDAPPYDGPVTVDTASGIAYRAFEDPWMSWHQNWTSGELQVSYQVGQYFVTEEYPGGQYLASILSGSVPAAVNDGTDLDLKCVSEQVSADVRDNYYPQPNQMEMIRDEAITLGGRPAWIREFRLTFEQDGLSATDELVGVALIDVGRAEAAVLYVSIPGSHTEYDHVVNEVMESVRPTD
ncbi:hypothetical protein FB566_1204 [Stackebrandtia endophytica]|uniref:Uncharacterized protein n=1 Tax=Stackebrandtia endophytica TaxID=1496996 RepID=A0A543ASX6_9ACTN|nr:hypothetical protein FB566_1204 [Stackebrandtia endophytica]